MAVRIEVPASYLRSVVGKYTSTVGDVGVPAYLVAEYGRFDEPAQTIYGAIPLWLGPWPIAAAFSLYVGPPPVPVPE